MTDEKGLRPKNETKRLEEMQRNLEDYVNDLRAIVERLRKNLH